jgi:alpha-acetolactate decarboxylase
VSNNFDEILESGDEAAIEAALAEMESTGDVLFGEEDDLDDEVLEEEAVEEVEVESEPEEKDVTEPVEEVKTEEVPESSTTEEKATQPGVFEKDGKLYVEVSADNTVIESKNGKHHVPYDVLVEARKQAADTKALLEAERSEKQQIANDLNEAKRVSDLYSKQLGEAGLDPKLLPEQMLKDPALMAQVKEDYPQIGELVEALASKLTDQHTQTVTAQQSESPAEEDPLLSALGQTAHLKKWQTDDADRWDFAKQIDNKLADDPLFADKTISERFKEVERRVMAAFGDEAPQAQEKVTEPVKAKVAEQPTSAPIPNSPTDIGQQVSDTNKYAHVLEQDASGMIAQMEKMSPADIEAMLEDASNFL